MKSTNDLQAMAPFVISLFFWLRGFARGSRGDVLFSLVLFVVSSFLAVLLVPHSGLFGFIGLFVFLFGLVTLTFLRRVAAGELMEPRSLRAIGAGLIIVGLIANVIL